MMKINQLNKYYNKNHRNENHVLKGIDVAFPKTGLVMLLGDSGSGKTTLLNIIGGLDKADSGAYTIDDTTIDKYDAKTVDKLRNKKIGYIFQNYYLFPHETVHENIRLTLKLVGLNDEAEIDRRINSLLKLVNMPQYKHRKANQLSGGQQQRIAIIRALAKNPSIIIADEPTGNLDSKNTLAIMRMLKEISKEKLIIMVTHEETIAKHYGDQIIKIEDGTILSHDQNGHQSPLDTTTDSDIYLGDLSQLNFDNDSQDRVTLYKDNSTNHPIKARLIVKNKTLYIDIEGDYRNINVLRENSDTTIHDYKREEVAKQESELPSIEYEPFKKDELSESSNVIPVKTIMETTFRKLKQSSKFSKLLYASFAFSAGIFLIALAMLNNIIFISEDQFLNNPTYTFEVYYNDFDDYDDFMTFLDEPFNDYLLGASSFSLELTVPRFYQTSKTVVLNENVAPISTLENPTLVHGEMPENTRELLISTALASQLLNDNTIQRTGMTEEKDLLKLTYTFDDETYQIAGIVDNNAPVFFGSKAFIYSRMSNDDIGLTSLYDIDVIEGRSIESINEVLIPSSLVEGDFETTQVTLFDHSFDVVGVYDAPDSTSYMMSEPSFEYGLFNRDFLDSDSFTLYTSDKSDGETFLMAENLTRGFNNLYDDQLQSARNDRMTSFSGLFVFAIISMAASALSFYFIIRSSMLKRIYEIGVYRALGVKRLDITKMFWFEILIITTFSSLIGYTLLFFFLRFINEQTREFIEIMNLSAFTFFGGIALIYIINSVFGLLPLFRVLRKTPAEIHSAYDL